MAPDARQADVSTLLTQGAAAASSQLWAPLSSASRSVPWRAVIAVALGVFTNALSSASLSPVLLSVALKLDAYIGALLLMIGANTLGLALALIPAGSLADRFGSRRLFVIGTIGCGLLTIVTGVAPNLGAVIALRFVQGVFAGLALPTGLAFLRDALSGTRLHVTVVAWGFVGASILVCVYAAPLRHLYWRLDFVLPGVLGAVAGLVGGITV